MYEFEYLDNLGIVHGISDLIVSLIFRFKIKKNLTVFLKAMNGYLLLTVPEFKLE